MHPEEQETYFDTFPRKSVLMNFRPSYHRFLAGQARTDSQDRSANADAAKEEIPVKIGENMGKKRKLMLPNIRKFNVRLILL
jgi:hypothetical protein